MKLKFSVCRLLAGVALLAAQASQANTIDFKGYSFSSFYGPENLVVNGLGHLETPTLGAASNFGGATHITSADFRASNVQLVTASTLEVGAGLQPSSQLWIQDQQGSLLYEAMFGSFAGGASFFLQTRVRDLTQAGAPSIDTDNYVFTPRTAGEHSFAVLNVGGEVRWLLDDILVATTGAGVWGTGLQEIERVLLFAHGNADAQIATWTDFALSTVPEPAALGLLAAGLLAAFANSRSRAGRR